MLTHSKFLIVAAALCAVPTGCVLVDSDSDGIGGFSEGGSSEGGSSENANGAGSQGGFGEGGFGAGGEGGSDPGCLDDIGSPAACDSTCGGVSNCNGLNNFKEGTAEYLVDCLNALNPAACDFEQDVLETCTNQALEESCIDPDSESYCSAIATGCGEKDDAAWQEYCVVFVDGLSFLGKGTFRDCAVETCEAGGTSSDMPSCFNVLFPE